MRGQKLVTSVELRSNMNYKELHDKILEAFKSLLQLDYVTVDDGIVFLQSNSSQGKPGFLSIQDKAQVSYGNLKS